MTQKDDIKHHTEMIKLYLNDIEQGHDTTGNISYHLLKIQDILVDITAKVPQRRI